MLAEIKKNDDFVLIAGVLFFWWILSTNVVWNIFVVFLPVNNLVVMGILPWTSNFMYLVDCEHEYLIKFHVNLLCTQCALVLNVSVIVKRIEA